MDRFLPSLFILIMVAGNCHADWTYELLHEFERPGTQPMAPLLLHTDGNYYGTTVAGGRDGFGTVFQVTPGGVITTLVSFSGTGGDAAGRAPIGGVTAGTDGALYGTTTGGGVNGFGVAFKVTTSGVYTVLAEFTGTSGAVKGSVPGELVLHADGLFYGTTQAGGASGFGTVFSMTATGSVATLLEFTGTGGAAPGSMPVGSLAVSGTTLFGVTQQGGAFNQGTVYSVTTAGTWTGLTELAGGNGAGPTGGVVLHSDGALYGVAEFGGTNGFGTAFKLTTGGTPVFSVLRHFDDPTGSQPVGTLVEGGDGAMYGMTSAGGVDSWGTIFRLTTSGGHSVLADFSGVAGVTAGSTPRAGLRVGAGGELYGTTSAGGPGNLGVVCKVTTSGSYTRIANFSLPLGWTPSGAPIADGAGGVLFPMAEGGDGGGGALLCWTSGSGIELAAALGGVLGDRPDGGLVRVGNEFFGVTTEGGGSGRGTSFKYDSVNGAELVATYTTTLGSLAEGPLVEGLDGALYGVSREGGSTARGTIYKLTTVGDRTRLASFSGLAGAAPGRRPRGGLALAGSGDLFGLTELGGAANEGVRFKVSTGGAVNVSEAFAAPGSHFPQGGMVTGADGFLYGTTSAGGASGAGTILRVDPGTENAVVVAEFADGIGTAAGREPAGELAVAADGTIWGMVNAGGPSNAGGVYSYSAATGLETVVSFSGTGGVAPGAAAVDSESGVVFTGGLCPQADGSILGVVPGGGSGGGGVLFCLTETSPLAEWKLAMLGDAEASDFGDPDGDRLVNLVEYALVLSPVVADSAGGLVPLVQAYAEGDRLAVMVTRDPSRSDVTVVVESSGDLLDPWTVLATSANGQPFAGPGYVGGDSAGAGLKTVEIRDLVNLAEEPQRFLRVRVTY